MKMQKTPPKRRTTAKDKAAFRFEPAKIDALFTVLDAVAWMDAPDCSQIAQFAGIDPRTAGKLLKNAVTLRLVGLLGSSQYTLALPYPYKGSLDQKKAVVKEALVRLPVLASVRQFLRLGDGMDAATRKAATISGVAAYHAQDFTPLLEWATTLGALQPDLIVEDLLDEATEAKEQRHIEHAEKIVAFLSHSSKDKPFIRQLAADLTAEGVSVWLDEQKIRVGESIPERIAQGLAESDYFLLALSDNSVTSPWVQKELNNALVREIERRRVTILPLRLDETMLPDAIKDKKYADFSQSYKHGLDELLKALKGHRNGN
jgi:hypothetical protein